jgi:hypothetical protein
MYMMKKKARTRWTIANARRDISTLVSSAAREPQPLYRRNKLVATVVSPDVAGSLVEPGRRSAVADALTELRDICAEEGYTLPVPTRKNRSARPRGRRR